MKPTKGKTSTATGALNVYEPKDRSPQTKPLTIPVSEACRLSGLGATTIWQFIRDGRLEIVRVAGIKRTLIIYDSLVRLLTPACPSQPEPRRLESFGIKPRKAHRIGGN